MSSKGTPCGKQLVRGSRQERGALEQLANLCVSSLSLGGQFKTDNSWTGKTDNYVATAETNEFYFEVSSVRKSVCTFVRQLRGPHLRTCA